MLPPLTESDQRTAEEHQAYMLHREQLERRRQIRGLLVLAIIVIVLSILRAGPDRVFPHRWWHPW